jgi:hypothetical protein
MVRALPDLIADFDGVSIIRPRRTRRGRPGSPHLTNSARPAPGSFRDYGPEYEAGPPLDFAGGLDGAKTLRGCQNSEYAWRARQALKDMRAEFPAIEGWCGDEFWLWRGVGVKHVTVMAELGRIVMTFRDGARLAAQLATQIAAMEPRPVDKEAVAMLRRWRLRNLGKPKEERAGDVEGLTVAIGKAIDDYLGRNPATPRAHVLEALEWLAGLEVDHLGDDGQGDDGG